MGSKKTGIAFAVAIMTLGIAWLLNEVGVLPAVEWVWTLGLAVMGILTVVVYGLDKVTAVVGPFLVIGSFFSILRQTGKIMVNYEVPILFIIFGLLILVAIMLPLKSPKWLNGQEETKR